MSRKKINKKLYEKKKKIKQSQKKGDKFKLHENWPTIGEAKELLLKELKKRGYEKVKNIKYSHKNEEFVITFHLQEVDKNVITKLGCGPYGLEKTKYSWKSVLNLHEKK